MPLAEDERIRSLVAEHYNVRTDWTTEQIRAIYDAPLLELVRDAAAVHRITSPRRRGGRKRSPAARRERRRS